MLTNPDILESREIILKKGDKIKGYAEYTDGLPAGGLDVTAHPNWWHSTTYPLFVKIEPNGFFTLPHIIPGEYSLNIHIPTGQGGGISYPVLKTTLPPTDEIITLTVPQKSPESLVSISGSINYTGGIPGIVDIRTYSPELGGQSTFIGGDSGTFTIDNLEPGQYRITFSGSNVETTVMENVTAPNENLEVTLRYLDKPILKGVVIRADTGEPIKTFRARTAKLQTTQGSPYAQSDRWVGFKNQEGSFNIEAVGPGIYQVQIEAEGFASQWSEEINTDVNEPVIIALSEGGAIKGRVVDEEGNPVSGAKVIPLSIASGAVHYSRDEFVSENGAVITKNGEFLFPQLQPGTETIKVTHPEYTFSVVEDITVEEGQTTSDIEVVLSKGGSAEGYVYNNQGEAQANVALYFKNDVGFTTRGETRGVVATAITDSNGFYAVKGLPRQMCYVHKDEPWNSLGVVSRAFLPFRGKITQLNFGGEPTVTGQLIIDGQPQSNTKVLLGDEKGPYFGLFMCYSNTTSSGMFSFSGVVDGRYSIYYESKQRRGNWIKAANIETGVENMDIGAIPEANNALIVYASSDSNDPNLQIKELYLEEGVRTAGQRAGHVSRPIVEGEPYIISSLLPGTYTAVVTRIDNVKQRYAVDINQQEQLLSLSLLSGTSQVSGQYLNSAYNNAILWRQDEAVSCVLKADDNGFFDVKHLPAGEYLIGDSLMLDEISFMRFSLAEGEHKIIEIEPIALGAPSALLVQVVDEDGIPIADSSVLAESGGVLVEPAREWSIGKYFILESNECTVFVYKAGYNEAMRKIILEPKNILAYPRQYNICYIRLER
jgi:hypothetical protein